VNDDSPVKRKKEIKSIKKGRYFFSFNLGSPTPNLFGWNVAEATQLLYAKMLNNFCQSFFLSFYSERKLWLLKLRRISFGYIKVR